MLLFGKTKTAKMLFAINSKNNGKMSSLKKKQDEWIDALFRWNKVTMDFR